MNESLQQQRTELPLPPLIHCDIHHPPAISSFCVAYGWTPNHRSILYPWSVWSSALSAAVQARVEVCDKRNPQGQTPSLRWFPRLSKHNLFQYNFTIPRGCCLKIAWLYSRVSQNYLFFGDLLAFCGNKRDIDKRRRNLFLLANLRGLWVALASKQLPLISFTSYSPIIPLLFISLSSSFVPPAASPLSIT